MTLVLGIDPGGVGGDTGIVLLQYNDTDAPTLIRSWAVPDSVDGFRGWYKGIPPIAALEHVIVEQFIDRQIGGADRSALLVEGAVRFVFPKAILSPASGKNTAVPNHVLKRLGLYIPGDHHRDRTEAARHVVRWLKNQGHVPTLRKGWTR